MKLWVDQAPKSKAYKLLMLDDISGQYINLRSAHEPSGLLAIQDQLNNLDRLLHKLEGKITFTSLFKNLSYIDRLSASIPIGVSLIVCSSGLWGATLYKDVRIVDLVDIYDLSAPIELKSDCIVYSIRQHINRPVEICAEIII